MNYDTFRTLYYCFPKDHPRRLEAIQKYPGHLTHLRNMSVAKLMEIRARKKTKEVDPA